MSVLVRIKRETNAIIKDMKVHTREPADEVIRRLADDHVLRVAERQKRVGELWMSKIYRTDPPKGEEPLATIEKLVEESKIMLPSNAIRFAASKGVDPLKFLEGMKAAGKIYDPLDRTSTEF